MGEQFRLDVVGDVGGLGSLLSALGGRSWWVAMRSRDREALKTQQTGGKQGEEGRGATFLGQLCFQNPAAKK